MKTMLKLLAYSFAFSFFSFQGFSQSTSADTSGKKTPPVTTGSTAVLKPAVPAKPASASAMTTPNPSQAALDSVTLKKYSAPRVFRSTVSLTQSTIHGGQLQSPKHPTAAIGQGFDVIGIAPSTGNLILKMWVWTLKKDLPSTFNIDNTGDIAAAINTGSGIKEKQEIRNQIDIVNKRQTLDYINYGNLAVAPDQIENIYYFTMPKDSVDQFSNLEVSSQKWDITFGILTTPFKIRYRRFAFTNNAGLGTAVFFQYKINPNWSHGVVLGFSLTSVTLDAASTFVHTSATSAPATINSPVEPLTTSTTRPAFTPSVSYVIAYKTINFTIGLGMDMISKPTDFGTVTNPEAGWIYNGKPWIGLGFGVSLFGNNSSTSATSADSGQSSKKGN